MSLIGIDIGNANCKIALREGAQMRLVCGRMPHNMACDGEAASPEAMGAFLRSVRKGSHVRERNCALVLSGPQVYFRHVSMPPMNASELALNLPYEFRDFIQDDPDGYLYDYALDSLVRDEAGEPVRMELFACAIPRALVESYADVLRRAGLRLKVALPSQMAYMRLLRERFGDAASRSADPPAREGEAAAGDVVLVDIGHANVAISLFRDLRYDSARTIDFGCDEFDSIIADLKGVDPHTAGGYKLANYEGVLDEPECLALCDRFALEVSKVVNFYNFSNPEREVGMLYFLGGGARISQLTNAITGALSVPCATADDLVPEPARGQDDALTCALALGALLEGGSV